MYLVFTKKFVYISLMATSVLFTWEALEKFDKQETAIQQYEDKIEAHPTIAICNFGTNWEYQKDFNISYTTYQSDGSIAEVVLKMGENVLQNSEGIIYMTIIYTRYNAMCYSIKTTRNVDERETEIKLLSPYLYNLRGFFTSEKNSYGATGRDWRDGEVYSFYISNGIRKDITLTVEKNINLKCNEESFYEYIASQLSDKSFEICNNTCLMTSLPNVPYPICHNYNEWSSLNKAAKESDCNWSIVRYLFQNITNNDEHLKTCITTKYSGISKESSVKGAEIKYKFALPLKTKVIEEYFIIDSIQLIGTVGGTLGMFIGFSFSNWIICIIEYLQCLIEKKLRSRKKFTETIWKCLEWIIYLSLMTAAILFAMDVIEEFFGQSTGIKQNMEKIENHPTITICTFLNQCDGPMKLILKLKGKPKKLPYLVAYEGSYILSSNLVNDKPYWTQKNNRMHVLSYDFQSKMWKFGEIGEIGKKGVIIGNSNGTLPSEVIEWSYGTSIGLIPTTTDIVVELGLPCLCLNDSHNYGTEFNFTYQTFEIDGLTSQERIPLKIGDNHLAIAKEKVSLTKIYSRWNSICYKINTTREPDFAKTEIKLNTAESKILETTKFFFTSEENSYGVTYDKFMDGKAFSTQLYGGKWKEIYLSVEKNMNLACSKESFFEYVESNLSESNFENCTHTCLRTSLPNEDYPICPNFEDWYENKLKGNFSEQEDDCNWSIVRDLIKNIITMDKRLKTCKTINYSGKIITEKNDQVSNELGIKYKFAFPLRAKVYHEFLITDTIDLVGSVGGMLGLFIGFSFVNVVTCMMGYIGTFLASRNKFSQDIWSSIEWILYLSLIATSIWFAWGVKDKFFKQETGIKQQEGKIETHPTIIICMGSSKYETQFYIKYKVHRLMNDYVNLTIGTNYIETLKELVNLTVIYTRYNGMCYAIFTTLKVVESYIFIRIMPATSAYNLPETIPVIFTSKMNSYGVTQRDWRDGEDFSFITSGGNFKNLDLTVEKNNHLKCSNPSFYEYVASRLSEDDFEKCNNTCLMTSLPNDPYPICHTYEKWYGKDPNEKEHDCNVHILRDLIKNITINEEHLKTCVTTQYLGRITFDKEYETKYARIVYRFASPLKTKVYEEYLITDGITLFGYLGGTLGLFIGFSIDNVVYTIMDFLQLTIGYETKRSLGGHTNN